MHIRYRTFNFIEFVIVILVLFMPTHRMLFDAVIKGTFDNLWRDILLIGIFIVMCVRERRFNMGKWGLSIVSMWFVCILYCFFSERMSVALNIARTYLVPTLIYFIVINSKLNKDFLEKIQNIVIYCTAFLALFGFFQAFVLGDSFLVNLGYESLNGHLKSASFYIAYFFGHQRVVSTFASPNICGFYFGTVILLLSFRMNKIRYSKVLMFVLCLGLITTFSRSAIMGTALALMVRCITNASIKDNVLVDKLKKFFIGIFFVFLIGLAISAIFNGQIYDMLESSFSSLFKSNDPSAKQHLKDIYKPIFTLIDNPLGLGFGNNGPMAVVDYPEANMVESSIFLLMYDFGIVGGLVFLIPYFVNVFKVFINIFRLGNKKEDNIMGVISILFVSVFFLLPSIQTYETSFLYFLLLAICEVMKQYNFDTNDKRLKLFKNDTVKENTKIKRNVHSKIMLKYN